MCVSLQNLKTSQAEFNELESCPVESWRMAKELEHGNNYIMHFYFIRKLKWLPFKHLMLYFVQNQSSLGCLHTLHNL